MTAGTWSRGLANLRRDASWSATVSALVVILVSYSGPFAILVQGALVGKLDAAQFSSSIWGFSIATGIGCIVLSLAYRAPFLCSWSTPTAVLLVSALATVSWSDAVGTFLVAALVTALLGATGLIDRLMRALTPAIAAALLAGILLRFGLDAFRAANLQPVLGLVILFAYLFARRVAPRFGIPIALAAGLAVALPSMSWAPAAGEHVFVQPSLTMPTFSMPALVGLGIPMILVTISGQFVPGYAALREAGYALPSRGPTTFFGLLSALFAPFGSHGVNPAAITIGICSGPDAHPQPERRYFAGVVAGVSYVTVGLFSGALLAFVKSVPPALIMLIAGLALLASITGSLLAAFTAPRTREAAGITFLVTASGIEPFGIASAFWGLVAGMAALAFIRRQES